MNLSSDVIFFLAGVGGNGGADGLYHEGSNLLASVDIPIVMVGPDAKIRRFTPKASQTLNLIPSDVGRSIGDIKPGIQALNGRDDFVFPLESSQKPLFQALATKEPDKKHILYDGGHKNPIANPDVLGEILNWLDRYLGPVELHP